MTPEKRILVTGSNGLVGTKVVDKLRDRPAVQLIASSRGIDRNEDPQGYVYEDLDVTDFDALKRVFEQHRPTDVIHTAAMTQVDDCELKPDLCEALNVLSVKHLCGLCAEYGSQLVHVSTDFIFDGENGPYAENATPNPLSVYGHSKLRAEQLVLASGIRAGIARTVLVYGTTPSLSRSNIVLWVKSSLDQGKQVNVVQDQFRSPTLAEDLAEGLLQMVFRGATGIWHLSGPEVLSVYDIALSVARFWKLDESLINPIDSATLNQPARRPPRTGFIILKAQTELGYQPHSLMKGLAVVDRQLRQTGLG
jgi:dTDP-4-dehydrorhamnose reductase